METKDPIYVIWEKDDPDNPYNWSTRKKHLISAVSINMTLYVASCAVSFAWQADQISLDLNVTREVALLGITVFTAGFAIAPMALAPISEVYGRTPVYLLTYGLFALLFIPQALSPSITGLLITRFVSGCMGSTGSTLVGGVLADIYPAEQRGGPMSFFSSVTLYGTALGSIVSAYTVPNNSLRWRWVFWIQLIINSAHFFILLLTLRETRGSVLLSRKAKRLSLATGKRYITHADVDAKSLLTLIKHSLTRPFFFLFREPAVILYSLWVSFVWGVLYLFLEAVPIVFTEVYGFTTADSSLAFLAMIVGTSIALLTSPIQDRWYNASSKATARPEARLYASMFGSLLFTAGLFLFGWLAYAKYHWIGCMIAIAMSSFGIFTIYLAVFNVLADSYGTYASSALAAQSFLRNAFASGFPLFARYMYDKLGIQWASSVLGFIGLVLSGVPFALFYYGPRIRRASKFATG